MKIEYESHCTGEQSIEIQYNIEVEPDVWILDYIICDLSDCYDQSYKLATPDFDKTGEYIQNGQLELKGYIQELEKEEEIGIDKDLTLEILENNLKEKYPNEKIEIV